VRFQKGPESVGILRFWGGPLRKSNFIGRSYKVLLAQAGLPMIPFRNLRHTAATLLLTLGEHPKVVQERLGHSRFGITMDVYGGVVPSVQRGAATKLEAFLNEDAKIGYS
jgi:integrase